MDVIAVVVLGVLAVAGIVWYRNRNNKVGRSDNEPGSGDGSVVNYVIRIIDKK